MEMLLSEMKNVLHYYEVRVAGILNAMDEYSNLHTALAKGAHALLHNILSDTYIHFHKRKELFTPVTHQLLCTRIAKVTFHLTQVMIVISVMT